MGVVGAAASLGLAQPTIVSFIPPGGAGALTVNGVSDDGSVVIGKNRVGSVDRGYRWSQTTGAVLITGTTGETVMSAQAISGDGNVITGWSSTGSYPRAYRRVGAAVEDLGVIPTPAGSPYSSEGFAVSLNGSVVVGQTGHANYDSIAFRWTAANGITSLGLLPVINPFPEGAALAISGDGLTIAGWSKGDPGGTGFERPRAVIWSNGGGPEPLPSPVGTEYFDSNFPMRITRDGRIVVGTSGISRSTTWLWTREGGLEDLNLEFRAEAINADATLIASREAVWTRERGFIASTDYLQQSGVNTSGWSSLAITAMNPSATAFAGVGVTTTNQVRVFVIRNAVRPCFAPQPGALADVSVCLGSPATLACSANATAPWTLEWQIERPDAAGQWVALSSDPMAPTTLASGNGTSTAFVVLTGSASANVTIMGSPGSFRVRAFESNACGSSAGQPSTIVVSSPYANCDGSTGTPSLTAADFSCFLAKFRAGDGYANCDGSTGSPTLTAVDFTCFLSAFRAGCP